MAKLKSVAEQMNKNFTPSLIISGYETGFMEMIKQIVNSM